MGNRPVSAAPIRHDVFVGIEDMGEVLEFTHTAPIGESREDDTMRQNIAEAMTPFQKKQFELNAQLRELKEAAKLVQKNKGVADYEAAKDAQAGRKRYQNAKKSVTKLKDELSKMLEQDRKDQEKKMRDQAGGVPLTSKDVQELADKKQALDCFDDQIEKVATIYDRLRLQHDKHSAEKEFGIAVDELGNMPELDPQSWVEYRQFLQRDRKIDDTLEELYKVNQEMLEIAQKVYEEGKKQDVLVIKNQKEVQHVLGKAQEANKRIQNVKDAIDGKGPGRICVYAIIVILIVAVAYGIYTIANGEDPCKEHNDQECTNLSDRRMLHVRQGLHSLATTVRRTFSKT